MPRYKNDPYCCPRCGYTTYIKSHMSTHLIKNKRICPATRENVIFTPDIIEFVLMNRVFHNPKENTPTINQTINNFNTMNNFVSSMDTFIKLDKFIQHKGISLLDFEEHVEKTLEHRASTLNNKSIGLVEVEIKKDDIFELVDLLTKMSSIDPSTFNIVVDKHARLKIFQDGEWVEFLTSKGTQRMLEILQEHFLHKYECFLLRKIKSGSMWDRQKAIELLDNYYGMLGAFDVFPYVRDHRDRDVLYDRCTDVWFKSDGSTDFCDKYMDRYRSVTNKLTKQEMSLFHKELVSILKQNTKRNIEELNKVVLDLINADEEFKIRFFKNSCS